MNNGKTMSFLKNELSGKRDIKNLLLCFLSTFVFGIAAHAYGLLNSIFSHDSLNAMYADSTENFAKVAVGRFLVPVVRCLRGPVAIPWLIGIISLFYIAISVYIVVRLFEVERKSAIILIAGVMTVNTTVTAIIGTYVHELDFDMLSLMLSLIAVYLWKNSKKVSDLLLSSLAVTASMALYQSYAEVTVTVIIMLLILDTLKGEKIKDVFLSGVRGAGSVVVGAVLYFAINAVVIRLTSASQIERVDITADYEMSLPARVVQMFKIIATTFFSPVSVFSTVFAAFINLLVLAVIALSVIIAWKKEKTAKANCVFTVLLFGLMLVGMNFVGLFSHEDVHDVMKYSFWFIYILAVVLAVKYLSNIKIKALPVAAMVLVAITVWNSGLVSNTVYLKKDLETKVTISTLNRVIADLEDRDDYEAGTTEIAICGYTEIQEIQPAFEYVSRLTGMRHTSITGVTVYTDFFNPYINLFKYYFNYPVNLSNKDFRKDSRVETMPCFPEKGYIENLDGVLVVKLGTDDLPDLGASNIEKDIKKIKNIITE